MAAVLAAAIYSSIGFSIYFFVGARRVRVPGGSKFRLEPGTIEALFFDNETSPTHVAMTHISFTTKPFLL